MDSEGPLDAMFRGAAARVERVTPAQAAAEAADGAVLVDIRTGAEKAERGGTIPAARRATDVVGGVEGWRAAGLPVDPPA